MKNIIYRYFKIFLILLSIVLIGCSSQPEPPYDSKIPVEVYPVHSEIFTPHLYFSGDLLPWRDANLAPSIPGRVERFYVQLGDTVKPGQLLVQLSGEMLTQAQAQLQAAEADYYRAKSLLENNAITPQAYDRANANYISAKAQRDLAAQAAWIHSPFKGIVAEKFIEPGEMYTPTPQISDGQLSNPGVIRIINIDTIKVNIDVTETELMELQVGMKAILHLDIFPDSSWIGEINRMGVNFNSLTRTMPVEVIFPNPDFNLTPGMFGRITIQLKPRQTVIIPEIAVVYLSGTSKNQVFMVTEDNRVISREVSLGYVDDDRVEIISGLQEGETIVAAGARNLTDGDQIKIIEPR